MPRTDPDAVRAVIRTDPSIDLTEHIDTAHDLTNYIASKDTDNVLGSGLLKRIETFLAAHYYSLVDPTETAKTTGDASDTYVERNWWEEAKKLDVTGTLAALGTKRKVQFYWLGKPPSQQIEWRHRN